MLPHVKASSDFSDRKGDVRAYLEVIPTVVPGLAGLVEAALQGLA